MDLREMHYLLEIANTGHMTQAANNLFIFSLHFQSRFAKLKMNLVQNCFTGMVIVFFLQIPEELSSKSPLRFSNLRPI